MPSGYLFILSKTKLDKYARPFVPNSLKYRLDAPATHYVSSESPFEIDLAGYAERVQLFSLEPQDIRNGELLQDCDGSISLDVNSYVRKFHELLSREYLDSSETMREKDMFDQKFLAVKNSETHFRLSVPGIVDNFPAVFSGDFIIVRDTYGNPPVTTEFWLPVVLTSRVSREITVQIDQALTRLTIRRRKVDVRFVPNYARFSAMVFTVKSLEDVIVDHECLKCWLFPDVDHSKQSYDSTETNQTLDFFDDLLNVEQKNAVSAIVARRFGHAPFLISGPPGTGKTKTLVEAILQLLKGNTSPRILVCAPSEAAADILAIRLKAHLSNSKLLRLNLPSRHPREMPEELLAFSSLDIDGRFSIPEFADFLKMTVIVSTCYGSSLLLQLRITNSNMDPIKLQMMEMFGGKAPIETFWTHMFMDEAGQATEPESLIPLRVVLPHRKDLDNNSPAIVLCGDEKQLGPKLYSQTCRTNGLAVSLFERLMERPLYASHPMARRNLVLMNKDVNISSMINFLQKSMSFTNLPKNADSTENKLWNSEPCFSNLFRNYRSHPKIIHVSSTLFYNSTLKPCAQDTELLLNLSAKIFKTKSESSPFIFVNVDGVDEMLEERASWYNVKEILMVEKIVQQICKVAKSEQIKLSPEEIGIITPYREAVRRLRDRLRRKENREMNLSKVIVGTVDDFQGAERRVIIVATIRTRERFLADDEQSGIGLVGSLAAKQMNVALTRAKQLLFKI